MKKITTAIFTLGCASLFALCPQSDSVDFNSSPLSAESQGLLQELERVKEEKTQILAHNKHITGSTEIPTLNESLADHFIASFPQDNIIKLEDGSEWSFDRNDIYQVRSWKEGHTLLLYPANDREKPYFFYNKDLGTYLKINPFAGPKKEGPKTNWIIGIDHNLGHVYLVNGLGDRSSWAVDPLHLPVFHEWNPKQTVLIASYNKNWIERAISWFFPSYDFVLINVNKIHNIPAKPL